MLAEESLLPSRVGRFQIISRLAAGGMAEIFKAKVLGDHGFEKTVVVKRILPHLAKDPEFVDMLIDEARLSARLVHPKIVQVFEFGHEAGLYFIAMEYVDGIDCLGLLRTCAQRRLRLPTPIACFIASEVLDALDFAHQLCDETGESLRLVHRDVSPSNVFISRRGDVKLGDFGIAHAVDRQRLSETTAGTLKGKYGYMAPEQVLGTVLDRRADVFAAGIVMAELLMGRRLFTAPAELDVLLMVRDARLDRLDRYGGEIPRPLRAILEKALRRDPDERYATAAEFRDAVLDYLYEERLRVGPRELGSLLLNLLGPPPLPGTEVDAPQPIGERSGPGAAGVSASPGLDGPVTQAQRVAAEAKKKALAQAVREVSALQDAGQLLAPAAAPATVEDAPDPTLATSIPGTLHTLPTVHLDGRPDQPHLSGNFREITPTRVLCRLAAERETGLLVVQRGEVVKDVFLVNGAPEFVSSNVASERFGEYLVAQGVIAPGELAMALAVLPRFNGRLGDTLVGLGLMRPLEVFRHLLRQVREKLIQIFGWTEGEFRYYRGRQNRRDAFPLGLDAFAIIGAAVAALPQEQVLLYLGPQRDRRVRRVERERPRPEQFRVGAGPQELWQRLDGTRTVGGWMSRYQAPEQFQTLCHTMYLLLETELATLDPIDGGAAQPE